MPDPGAFSVEPARPSPPPASAPSAALDRDGAIQTPRLTLRRLREHDRHEFIALVRANITQLAPHIPMHRAGEDDDAFFDRMSLLAEEGDRRGLAWRRVATLRDGTLVGCFHLNSITRGLSWEGDAAWWIGREHAGQGLATEGLAAMLAHAFAPLPAGLGLNAIHCGIEASNDASRRVAIKAGFVHRPGRHSYLRIGSRWAIHEFYLADPESVARASSHAV